MSEWDKWTAWAVELQSLAQAGLTYGHDVYDQECYTRAAVFQKEKILLVHEKNGTWSLPGGWCDVNQTIGENTEKETLEEAGFRVRAERLIAVQDRNKHNEPPYAYGIVKVFLLCGLLSGEFMPNIETTEIGWFSGEDLPENLALEKTTKAQIEMCFEAEKDKNWKVLFD